MRLRRFASLAITLLALRSFSLGAEDGGRPGTFLDFGASARSLAMGHAFTGVADDASAIYWNPSGLVQLKRRDAVLMYSALEQDTKFSALSYSQPTLRLGTFGFGMVSLESGSFDKRSATGQKVGSSDIRETGFLLSHGFSLSSRLALGSTVKVVRQKMDVYSDTGFGLDAGLLWKLGSKWQTGAAVTNLVAPSMKLRSETEKYPQDLKLGAQWMASSKLLFALDLDQVQNGLTKINLGTQWIVAPLVALRAGMNKSELTAGLGLNLGDWDLDYAFGLNNGISGEEKLGSSHRFGLHLAFGKTRQEMQWLAQNQRYRPLAQKILIRLRDQMSMDKKQNSQELQELLASAADAIRYGGFPNSAELYEAQAYVLYLQNKNDESIAYLSEALAFGDVPNRAHLEKNYQKVLAEMNEEQKNTLVEAEIKKAIDFFKNEEWKKTIETCEAILAIDPQNIEAHAYKDDAQKHLTEPIERGLRIARAKFERGEYLDVIKHLQQIQRLDPGHAEATALMNKTMEIIETMAPASGVQEIIKDSQKSRELFSKGLQYYSQGKLQDALTAWREAVRHDQTNISAKKAYERALLETSSSPTNP